MPESGTFLSVDPVESEPPYQYVQGNVVNRVDPSGKQGCPPEIPYCEDPWLPVKELWKTGFEPLNDAGLKYYQRFVDFWDWVYRKDNPVWGCDVNSDGLYNDEPTDASATSPNDTSYHLVRDFVCEYGPQTRYFSASDQATKNLRNSAGIILARNDFYMQGKTSGDRKFGFKAVLDATIDVPWDGLISHVLGGYSYDIEQVGPRLQFRVENNMTRQSGTRVPNSYEGLTHEDILDNPNLIGSPVESVLREQTREQTTDPVGGGNLKMFFYWYEFYDECRTFSKSVLVPIAPVPIPFK